MVADIQDIQWIVFDAVGTLVFADPPVAEVYHQIGMKHRSRLTLPEVEHRFADAFSRHTSAGDLSSSEPAEHEFWKTVVGEVLCDVEEAEACFAELHAWFANPSAWRCYPDVVATLEVLRRRGYRLAMASNFDARLHAVRAGLTELEPIELCVVSSYAGRRKPHHGFFTALIEACGSAPHQILMVGDNLESDVRGAKRAGLQSRLLVRDAAAHAIISHEASIRSLAELIDDLDNC